MGNKVGNIGGACEGLEPVIKIVKNGILKQTSEIIDIEEVDKHIISASTNVDEFISSAINDLMEVFDD